MELSVAQAESVADTLVIDAYKRLDFDRLRVLFHDVTLVSHISSEVCTRLLRDAIIYNDVETVKLVIGLKPNLDPPSQSSGNLLSPLWISILFDALEIAELLVRAGADVNRRLVSHPAHERYSSLLHVLACTERIDESWTDNLIELLLDHGADVNARDKKGQSVLHCAVTMGRVKMVRLLLERGARVDDYVVNVQGETILHSVVQGTHADQLVPLLLSYGANSRAKDCRGMNALHLMSRSERPSIEAARVLIQHGTPFDEIATPSEYTPLHYAVMYFKEDLVKFLLECGADVNARAKGGVFPLYVAAKYVTPSMIELLLNLGASIHDKTDKGKTALHGACKNVLDKNIRILLELGADLNAKDEDGNTPFSLIKCKNTSVCIKTMIRYLAKLYHQGRANTDDLKLISEYPRLQCYYDSCLIELATLRNAIIHNNISMYHVLYKDQYALASLARNSSFIHKFRLTYRTFSFPLYAPDCYLRFKNAKSLKITLCEREAILNSIFGHYLPNTVLKKVAYYSSPKYLFSID